MSRAFNVLDEPWLPVRMTTGEVREVGLLEVFRKVDQVAGLADTAPPSLIAEYRLLLAILHRAMTRAFGTWKDRDRADWLRNGLPIDSIERYLEDLRERFWLFHPEDPFMQVARLEILEATCDKTKPWSQISLASASGNIALLFDHTCEETLLPTSPADALRCLLGFLQCTPGGLVKVIRSADKAGPLANTAAVIPIGNNLRETLCLALHPATLDDHQDLPAWEQPPLALGDLEAEGLPATGPNDRYTRLSRAVLLLPGMDGLVRELRFAAGKALLEDEHSGDPMASFRSGSNGFVRLTFTEGRAFWRDLPALLPDATGQVSKPAPVLSWAASIASEAPSLRQMITAAGLASDKAKLLRWRLESLSLPAIFLEDPDNAQDLRDGLQQLEELHGRLRTLAVRRVGLGLPDPGSKDTRARARALLDASGFTAVFFAEAERKLHDFISLLANGEIDTAWDSWRNAQRLAVDKAWRMVDQVSGQSPKALQAEAKCHGSYLGLLKPLLPQSSIPSEVHA